MNKFVFILVPILLCACGKAEEEGEKTYSASIGIVNHTGEYIYSTTVNGRGGGHAGGYSAGIGNMCCVMLPYRWQPGLKVTVGWDIPVGTEHTWKERIVEIEKYEEPGSLYLHFFPNDKVRIVVSNWVGGSPDHPIPPPTKPQE